MKSLGSRTTALAIAGVVAVAPLAVSTGAGADPIDDQRAKVEFYADRLERLEQQAMRLAEDYDVALAELKEVEAEVAAAEEAVAAKQAEVTELQGQLGDVAVQAFMGAGTTGLGVFADPVRFNEELQRSELTRVAMNTGTADFDDLQAAVRELAEEQANLESQRDYAETKKAEVASARNATESQTAEYKDARREAEAELGELIRKEEERRARESWERMQAEARAAEERARAQAQSAQQSQQQASNARPTSGGGGSTSSGGGGGGGGGAASVNIPVASSRAGTAVNAAMSQRGVAYKFAAAQPGVAFDCSGLTSWAWAQAGVSLPHQSASQASMLPSVPKSEAQPGDLIFYYSPVSHVGMYVGGGNLIHAPNTGSQVHVRAVNWDKVVKVGRPG